MQLVSWANIGTSIVTSTIASGIFSVFIKAIFDRELEKYKKSYGLLIERQADVIERMYDHLVEAHIALLQSASPMKTGDNLQDQKLYKILHQSRVEGYNYFRRKRFFSRRASLLK